MSAALAMYDRACKIHDLIADVQSFMTLAEEQLLAYTIAINSLSLVDQGSAWFVLSSAAEGNPEVSIISRHCLSNLIKYLQARKRRKVTRHIPEAKQGSGKYEAEVIQLADIQHDYAALSAHIDLVRSDPTLMTSEGLVPIFIFCSYQLRVDRFLPSNVSHYSKIGPSESAKSSYGLCPQPQD